MLYPWAKHYYIPCFVIVQPMKMSRYNRINVELDEIDGLILDSNLEQFVVHKVALYIGLFIALW